MGPDTGETRHEETAMHQSRSTDGLSGEEAPSSPRPSMGAHSGNGGRALWERLGLLAVSAVVAVAAGLVTRVRWGTEPTADLAALLLHVGVLAVGVGGMLGVVALPRGRRSGLGLALMATSMLVLFAAPAWHLGPLATTGARCSHLDHRAVSLVLAVRLRWGVPCLLPPLLFPPLDA